MKYLKSFNEVINESFLFEAITLDSKWKQLTANEYEQLEVKVGVVNVKEIQKPQEYEMLLSTMLNKTYWMSPGIPKKTKALIESLMNHFNIKFNAVGGADLIFINANSIFTRFIEAQPNTWKIFTTWRGKYVTSKKLKQTTTQDPSSSPTLYITDDDGPTRDKVYNDDNYLSLMKGTKFEDFLKNKSFNTNPAEQNKLLKDTNINKYFAKTVDSSLTPLDIINSKNGAIWLNAKHLEKFTNALDRILYKSNETYEISDEAFIEMVASDNTDNLELLLQQATLLSINKDTLIKGLIKFYRSKKNNNAKVEKLYKIIDPDFYNFEFPRAYSVESTHTGLLKSIKGAKLQISIDTIINYMTADYKDWLNTKR